LTTATSAPSCPRVSSYPSARRRVMMRSLSTSAFGQPSETKLTFVARPLSEFRFSICEGLPEHERGSKRSSPQGGRAHLRRATAATKCKAAAKTAPPDLNLAFCHCVGRVAEWFKAAVLKIGHPPSVLSRPVPPSPDFAGINRHLGSISCRPIPPHAT
jgi:hypothetical protein